MGFNEYKNHLSEREYSTIHKECISALCAFGQKSEQLASLAAQVQNEQDNWINALRSVVLAAKFLASWRLLFRERDELVLSTMKTFWNN